MYRPAAAVEGRSSRCRSGCCWRRDELFEEFSRRPGDLHHGVIEGGGIPTGRGVEARHLSDELQGRQVQLLVGGKRVLLAKPLDVAAHRIYLTKTPAARRRDGCLRSTGTKPPVRPKPPPPPAREAAGC